MGLVFTVLFSEEMDGEDTSHGEETYLKKWLVKTPAMERNLSEIMADKDTSHGEETYLK